MRIVSETQEHSSYLLENSPFFLSSSNPKKVNGAMNTNINNKKFKLVPLRNQPMQAICMQARMRLKRHRGWWVGVG
ncbi:hypothetical protein WN55_01488 [Dufourea novaeangliae]|uniref:Uncharacterized protein n=1 Tax=Dufourea novaeangliae TaxID=178035 RepID=A0A154PEV9_DUFNO|nr:hypothetical protein WN55_01488 [Dufourea novaeangliae]